MQQSSRSRCSQIPVLWLVVATHVRTPQLLNQDPNDADEQDEVHLGDKEETTRGVSRCFHPQKEKFSVQSTVRLLAC